jgi:glycosyltransferase involved in cell wall biosynthesis
MTRVLWYSNMPWTGTGYGTQTALTTKAMQADGHDVAICANWGLHGTKIEWEGITAYPGGLDVWANDVVGLHARDWFRGEPGWIISLADCWVLQGPAWEQHRVASWVPVDHTPVPPKVADFFVRSGAVPIAMAKFGQEELARIGIEAHYAPHGIDTDVFRRVDEFQGRPVRDMFGIQGDAFVVGMNAANKGTYKIRKSFPQAFAAFGIFAKRHPDAVLYVHAEKFGHADGVNLVRLAKACGVPDDRIAFTDQYAYRVGLPEPVVAAMYSAFDVLLAPSMGEGFGIPVIEAQACGVPVIVANFSAQPELVGSGWAVGGLPDWDEHQASWLQLPNIMEIVDALELAYNGEGRPDLARAKAEQYDIRRTWDEHWRPIMADLEARTQLPAPIEASGVNLAAL